MTLFDIIQVATITHSRLTIITSNSGRKILGEEWLPVKHRLAQVWDPNELHQWLKQTKTS